jgi:hypothetical protein
MSGITGFGATLSGSTSLGITRLKRIGIGGIKTDTIDISAMDSEDWMEFLPKSLADPGDITFEVNYDGGTTAGNFDTLETAIENKTIQTWTITFSDLSTWAAPGVLTSLSVSNPLDDVVTVTGTIGVTGTPTFTAHA